MTVLRSFEIASVKKEKNIYLYNISPQMLFFKGEKVKSILLPLLFLPRPRHGFFHIPGSYMT